MDTLSSGEFRKRYVKLDRPTTVVLARHNAEPRVMGVYIPREIAEGSVPNEWLPLLGKLFER